MQLHQSISAEVVAQMVKGIICGEETLKITGRNEIQKVQHGDLTFADHPKYIKKALASSASAILVPFEVPTEKTLIVVQDPFSAYNQMVKYLFEINYQQPKEAFIGKDTQIGANVFLGNHVIIGNQCIIHPNVVIHDHCIIGDRVVIQANTTIGSDPFYFRKNGVGFETLQPCGRVLIGNDVQIGAACTVDRGVSGDTIIGENTRLDNQVMIGHGVEIGKNCILAAQVGIAGKTILEDDVILWGQVGVSKCLRIGKGAVVLAKSGVSKNLEGGKTYFGSPAMEARMYWKKMAGLLKED